MCRLWPKMCYFYRINPFRNVVEIVFRGYPAPFVPCYTHILLYMIAVKQWRPCGLQTNRSINQNFICLVAVPIYADGLFARVTFGLAIFIDCAFVFVLFWIGLLRLGQPFRLDSRLAMRLHRQMPHRIVLRGRAMTRPLTRQRPPHRDPMRVSQCFAIPSNRCIMYVRHSADYSSLNFAMYLPADIQYSMLTNCVRCR